MDKPAVLIVDDEPVNQFLLEGLLTENSYETRIAENGFVCLELLESFIPDLILLDIMMPGLSGVQVLAKIIEHELWKNIPVIMVSAKTDSDDIKDALDIGAIDYIKKPFNEVELLARVKVGIRLKKNEDSLRENIKLKNDFIKIISHDLRSPFTAIQGYTEIMLMDQNFPDKYKRSLEYILESVEHSSDYFDKLLNWAMLSHHNLELNKEEENINNLCSKVINLLEKKARDKNIQLINETEESLVIEVDKTFFSQVISNLINNSIKFTPVDGVVKCFNRIRDNKAELIISDSGVGMPENISPKILFSSNKDFIKSSPGTKGEKGTGTGLIICNKIVKAHGFSICFKRNDSGGTDFIITLK